VASAGSGGSTRVEALTGGNRKKSEVKHGFSVADVESILTSPLLFAGRIVEPVSSEKRYLLLGVTADARYAAVVFTRRARSYARSVAARCGARRRRHTMQRGKKSAASRTMMKNASSKRDATLRDFEERDLGDDIAAAGTARMLRPMRATMPTSIVLEKDLVEKLRAKGAKRGLGYQTMLKVIVREHVDEY
jgi:uncharacterized DUF497 family protein/predicted DNA binding CopG/RHH family protein